MKRNFGVCYMAKISRNKKQRQQELIKKIEQDPFLTDDELSDIFCVSVPTIRLDRLELNIPEVRERIKNVAAGNYHKVTSLRGSEIIGELVDLNLGVSGISILQTDETMAFMSTKIVRGHYIYSLAESLAIAVIDAPVALVGVANIKYKSPVDAGSRLVAKAEVRRVKNRNYIVWVMIYEKQVEVFRGKFILVSLSNQVTD